VQPADNNAHALTGQTCELWQAWMIYWPSQSVEIACTAGYRATGLSAVMSVRVSGSLQPEVNKLSTLQRPAHVVL
jgi:hypothetical protein